MENKFILITGGAGSIGSELVRQLAPKNRIFIIDIDETRLFDLIEELRQDGYNVNGKVQDICDLTWPSDENYPEIIFHVAARKHVTPMEYTPMEAVRVNIQGTFNIIEWSKKWKAQLINISTDKVVNANSIMGATKKVAEIMVKNADYTSVRFGNVMGSRGSVIPIWQSQKNKGKPLTITDEKMERYMMTIEEACHLLIQAAQMDNVKGKIIILDMGKPVKILDLAKKILGKEKETNIRIIGIRPGEQITEHLMTEEEEKTAIKKDNFYILCKM